MNTIFLDQSAALDGHLAAMANLPPVAWEGLVFEPVQGVLYLMPENEPLSTVAETERDMTKGVYIIDVFASTGKGKGDVNLMIDIIANWFMRGTKLTYNGINIEIENVSRNVGNNPIIGINSTINSGWFYSSVLIKYFSLTQRR